MTQKTDEAVAVRVRTDIKEEENLYVCIGKDICFAKFAYENWEENHELRNIITAVCDAVTVGLERLMVRNDS